MIWSGRSLACLAMALGALTVVGCGPGTTTDDAGDAHTGVDGTGDVAVDGPGYDVPADGHACMHDNDCDDGLFCNGTERCIGGVCASGSSPCEDHASCTTDSCSETTRMCTHTPDDGMCGDMNACNGVEHCAPTSPGAIAGTGCQPVVADNIIDCDDGNTCTIDGCDTTAGCIHSPRDLDGDGHVDRSCTVDGTPTGTRGDDCDDSDPTVYPGAPENCSNGRDDNCDGLIDYEDPTCIPSNDTCATATVLPGAGTYVASVRALHDDYTLTCNTTSTADAVFRFTTTMAQDITISSSASGTGTAVALLTACSPYAESRCNAGSFSTGPTVHVHNVPAGTYYFVVEAPTTMPTFSVSLSYAPATPVPAEDTCPPTGATMPSVDISSGTAVTAPLSTLEDDYTLSCDSFASSPVHDAVYRITLTATSDVRVTATATSSGFSTTYLSFRTSPCASSSSETRCVSSSFPSTSASTIQRSLAAGTYWVIVENSANLDLTVQATITPPGVGPADDICPPTGTTPSVELNDGLPHVSHLAGLSDDYLLSCDSFASSANDGVYRLTLTSPMDVSLSATASTGTTYVSFRNSPCALTSSEQFCRSSFPSLSFTERALPAGTYWLIVENSSTVDVTLTATLSPPSAVVHYTASDSPTGVSFIDACATTGHVTVLDSVDDGTAAVPSSSSPFPLRMYGVPASASMTVCSNGWFSLLTTSVASLSGTIPDPTEPNLIVAPLWMDLRDDASAGVCYVSTGTAPNRKFVVEWNNASEYPGTSGGDTFEIIFNEAPAGTNNTIDVVYQTLLAPVSHTPVHGVEDDTGTLSTTITGSFTAPRVVRLTPM